MNTLSKNLSEKLSEYKIFNSVIVVTDRKVLNSQLQDTVYQFERVAGVVEKIDKDSAHLKYAINGGKNFRSYLKKFAQEIKNSW